MKRIIPDKPDIFTKRKNPAQRNKINEPEDGRRYGIIRQRLVLLDLAVLAAWLVLFQWSGASHLLSGWWVKRYTSPWISIAGYLTVFGCLTYAVGWPVHFYGSYLLEHRFGLSRMKLKAWWAREAKLVLLRWVFMLILVEGLYALLRHAPDTWPLWATAGWVFCSIVLARIFPTLLVPLFYRSTPLEDSGLTRSLKALCHRAGLSVLGVYRLELGAETRKANAALAGIGKSRRVFLADTLLDEFTHDEIESVLAHEVAHYHYRHILKTLVFSAASSWLAFLLTEWVAAWWVPALALGGLADIAGLPVLSLWLLFLGTLSLPIQNGLSRTFEWEADRYAWKYAKTPSIFADALRRLGKLNLADPAPPRWVEWVFYDHPAINRRIEAAEAFATRAPAPVRQTL